MLLLDTSVAIHLRDHDLAISSRLSEQPHSLALSLITLVELEGGVAAVPAFAPDRRAALDALLRRTDVLPFDRDTVTAYGAILRTLGFSRPRILDRLIAATAIVYDLTLVTINGADFRDIPDLKLEVWPSPPQ